MYTCTGRFVTSSSRQYSITKGSTILFFNTIKTANFCVDDVGIAYINIDTCTIYCICP